MIISDDKPNETVFNRPLFRLKREIRELKSVLDILTGVPIETWSTVKFYERDEYVSYNGRFYRSAIDGNVGNRPDQSDKWVHEQISVSGSSIPKFRIKTVSSGYSTVNADFDCKHNSNQTGKRGFCRFDFNNPKSKR